jgi:hypothetical protein
VLAALLGGCLVEPLPDEPVSLSFAVEVPPAGTRAPTAATNPWDDQGYFRLGWPEENAAPRFPKLVRVAVEVNGLELKSGTWPDAARGIGAGESPTGEVNVELQVQAGAGRQLRALGFLHDGQSVLTYEESRPVAVDLVAGKSVSVDLLMAKRATAKASITVRCQSGSGGAWRPRGIALADASALVIFPELPLAEDAATGALVAEPQVPVARYHWVRAILEHVTTKEVRYLDKRQQTFVTAAGQTTAVNVSLPCEILQ